MDVHLKRVHMCSGMQSHQHKCSVIIQGLGEGPSLQQQFLQEQGALATTPLQHLEGMQGHAAHPHRRHPLWRGGLAICVQSSAKIPKRYVPRIRLGCANVRAVLHSMQRESAVLFSQLTTNHNKVLKDLQRLFADYKVTDSCLLMFLSWLADVLFGLSFRLPFADCLSERFVSCSSRYRFVHRVDRASRLIFT